MRPLKLYWSSSIKNGRKNFGDWLSPALCQHISKREIVYAAPNECDLVAIGSILHRIKNHFWNRRVGIWGSGFISEQEPISARHRFHAVRGKKTAGLIKGASIEAFGDPGILVDLLLPEHAKVPKKHKVGIIPHYKDQANPAVLALASNMGDVKMLDIFSETSEFLHQVASCELILSSSLHGLVTADAFGIPNAWIKISGNVRGDDFKFRDYYSVFDIQPDPLLPSDISKETIIKINDTYDRNNIDTIKNNLLAAFPASEISN